MIARRTRPRGFTLVELLVAVAILAVLGLILSEMFSQSLVLWIGGQNDSDYRNRERAALNYIKRDLEIADLACNQRAMVAAGRPTLELLTSPAGIAGFSDTIFWQAPIATDNKSSGNMAEVGYFIRWISGRGVLCRFLVNPSDTTFYTIYSSAPGTWVTQDLLDQVAPATSEYFYRDLFLSDIVGLWVRVYPDPMTSATPYPNPYDSSAPPDATHPLPAFAVIQIATLDAPTAIRVAQVYQSGSSSPSAFSGAYAAANSAAANANATNAQVFVNALNQISPVRGGARAFSLRIRFNNYRQFAAP